MFRLVTIAGFLGILSAGGGFNALQAGVYNFVPATGSVNLDLFGGGGFDINGSGAFSSATLPANPILILDNAVLTHPGNTLLFGTDAGTTSQFALVIFNLAGATTSGTDILMPGVVNAVVPPACGPFAGCQPVADPGLLGLLGVVKFDFQLSGGGPPDTTRYQLLSITPVPEPSALALTLSGVALLASFRLRGSRRSRNV